MSFPFLAELFFWGGKERGLWGETTTILTVLSGLQFNMWLTFTTFTSIHPKIIETHHHTSKIICSSAASLQGADKIFWGSSHAAGEVCTLPLPPSLLSSYLYDVYSAGQYNLLKNVVGSVQAMPRQIDGHGRLIAKTKLGERKLFPPFFSIYLLLG